MPTATLSVLVTTPEGVLFSGAARHAIFPGEQGTFEILPLHRPLVSRLRPGAVVVGPQVWMIRAGVVSVMADAVTAVVELHAPVVGAGERVDT